MPDLGDRLTPEAVEYAHTALALLEAWDNETERGRVSRELVGELFGDESQTRSDLLLGLLILSNDLLDEVATATGTARDEVIRDLERRYDEAGQVS